MDISKCAEIKRTSTCLRCGGDLEGQHVTDFDRGRVREVQICPACQEQPLVLEHPLQ